MNSAAFLRCSGPSLSSPPHSEPSCRTSPPAGRGREESDKREKSSEEESEKGIAREGGSEGRREEGIVGNMIGEVVRGRAETDPDNKGRAGGTTGLKFVN